MLDYRVDTFLAVCQYMNYTRAAQELGITQPAVSQHIAWLEENTGVRLFLYQNRKLLLTEEGRKLEAAMRAMKVDEQHLLVNISSDRKKRQSLRIGMTLTVGEYGIQKGLPALLKGEEDLDARIEISNTRNLLHLLDQGELDMAVVEGYFDKTEYEYRVFSREPYIAVCSGSREDRYWGKAGCTMEELLQERLVCREDGSGTLEILRKCLQERNLKLTDFHRIIRVTNMNVIKRMVEADCGITFLYETAVREELEKGTLHRIPLQDFRISHDFTFIWRKNSIFGKQYEQVCRQLQKLQQG